jgi:hypothetical protein
LGSVIYSLPQAPSDSDSDSDSDSESDVTIDSGSKNATVLTREVHVATYKGEIEAMSYSDSSEAGVPKITTLIAKIRFRFIFPASFRIIVVFCRIKPNFLHIVSFISLNQTL